MKPFIIISIKDMQKRFTYDIEVPTDVPVGKLQDDIVEVLNHYDRKLQLKKASGGSILYCERLKRSISLLETFQSAGIWNGDKIIINTP